MTWLFDIFLAFSAEPCYHSVISSKGAEFMKKIALKKWQIVLLCLLGQVILAAAAVGVMWLVNVFDVTISIAGPKELTLEYSSPYKIPEASATGFGTLFCRKGKQVPVEQDGTVDTTKVGDYTLTYRAQFHGVEREKTITVHIVDTQAPVITLTADPEGYTLPGHSYQEEGFQAVDGYDGDITDRVDRTETDTEIIYTVSDAAGNRTEVRRTIVYNDPVPPELTLLGSSELTLTEGGSFQEPGYAAQDNCDGDITGNVTVSGQVDTGTPGQYTLTYSVSDNFGNTVSATRKVTVKPAPKPELPPPNPDANRGKVIYLTFDDGPSSHTRRLLEILNKYQVKATFFLVKTGSIDVAKEIVEQGHAVGIHSLTHDYQKIYASEEAYFSDLLQMQSIIEEKTGVKTTLMRFPGGSSNQVSKFNPGIMTRLTQEVQERGFQYVDWNVSSGDAGGGAKTADDVFYNVVRGIGSKSVSVVLQHDIYGFSVDAVERIIVWGLKNGYTFLPLTPDSPACHHNVYN